MNYVRQHWKNQHWNQRLAASKMSNASWMNYIGASSNDEHATDVVDVCFAAGGLVLAN